jgi:hypothetical protein
MKWSNDGSSKCGRFWTMKTKIGWRLYDNKTNDYRLCRTQKECKELAENILKVSHDSR